MMLFISEKLQQKLWNNCNNKPLCRLTLLVIAVSRRLIVALTLSVTVSVTERVLRFLHWRLHRSFP